MNPHDRAIDHLHLAAMRFGDYVHQPVPDPSLAPAIEAIVGRRIWPIALRKIAPWRAGPQRPEDAIEHTPVVFALGTRTALRQHRFDDSPLEIRQVVAHDPTPQVEELESLFANSRYK